MDDVIHPAETDFQAQEAQTRAVLARNGAAFARGDLEAILANYGEDAVVIRPDRVYRGLEAIRGMFQDVLANFEGFVPQGSSLTVAGRFALMTWTASSGSGRIVQGVDTFVIENDCIVAQSYLGAL
ncbi:MULTISPECIES: nuclear transport factor 2 family protein [Aphanothece]|uniref:nuclear transport factor 2 family protein n=1 Tax=Aphanothece TaxID=1121 RepID=UPI00398561DE